MIYQFIDWRLGLFRRMCTVQVESLFSRLRELDNGILPMFLRSWEYRCIFAGEAGILLPENRNVAESITHNESYPNMAWLDSRYGELLQYVRNTNPTLLVDPPAVPKNPFNLPAKTETPKVDFDAIVEKSVSNTAGKEDEKCSDVNPAISTPTSISAGSPISLLTTEKLPSQTRRR